MPNANSPLAHFNGWLQASNYQLCVTVFAITMAWVLGLIIPTVMLL